MPVPTSLGVHAIIEQFRRPASERPMLVSAHRGLRWDGATENSKDAILAAANMGVVCVEIDVRLTSDGVAVVLHDEGLGRVTDVAEYMGREDVYNPFTGHGYMPSVNDVPWSTLSQLRLKDENGQITDTPVLRFDEMLDFITQERLDMAVFMDIKESPAFPVVYEIVKQHKNARGVPALEWCVFKLDTAFFATPAQLEAEPWFADALKVGKPLYIPVYEPGAYKVMDVMGSAKAWASRPYCVALEVSLRGPGGLLQDLVDWAAQQRVSLGFFAALGDIHPEDGAEVRWDTAAVDLRACRGDGAITYFRESLPPTTFDEMIQPGESADGTDGRWDLERYKAMGFCWTIIDLTHRSVDLFRDHAQIQQPLNLAWRNDRLARVAGQ